MSFEGFAGKSAPRTVPTAPLPFWRGDIGYVILLLYESFRDFPSFFAFLWLFSLNFIGFLLGSLPDDFGSRDTKVLFYAVELSNEFRGEPS
jgi:hypothetical protein